MERFRDPFNPNPHESTIMKTPLIFVCLLSAGTLQSATWTVDSNTSRPADFRTLQAANDSENVANGDVLHVMPSTVGYGNVTLSKGLSIIGPGYLLNQNLNFTVAAPSARTGTITIAPGADGSLITGLEIGSAVIFSAVSTSYANNVTLKRNYIQGGISFSTGANSSNLQILQNHMTGGCSTSTMNSGLLVRGNYLGGYWSLSSTGVSGIFSHNVVDSGVGSTFGGNMLVENNLFFSGLSRAGSALLRSNWSNTPHANNSTWTTELKFVDQFEATGSVDAKWQLNATAAVRGTGQAGVNPGHFAGPDPYVISGLPSVPMVIGVQAPSSASAASGLPVTVDVQVNP